MNEVLTQKAALSLQLFNLMVEQFPDYCLLSVDSYGEINSWNKSVERLFGYTENEIVGKNIAAIIPEAEFENVHTALNNAAVSTEILLSFYHKTGAIINASVKIVALNADSLQSIALIINATPKTHQPSVNHNFLNSEFFKLMLANSPSGISLLDQHLNFTYHSPVAYGIAGLAVGDQHQAFLSIVDENDVKSVGAVLQEVLVEPNMPKSISFKLKGAKEPLMLKGVLTNMLADDNIATIIFHFWNATDEHKASLLYDQTISELSAYKYALDESAIVAITDQKGIIKHVNQNFCTISKYQAEELIGQDHRIINSSFHEKTFIQNLWKTIANGKIWKGELKNKAKDGTHYWVDTTIVPFIDINGKPYQYVAIRSDITERKNSEIKIRENEVFVKTLTDNLPAMVAYWSTDLTCQFMNKVYLDLLGKKNTDEVIGKQKCELIRANHIGFNERETYLRNAFAGKKQTFKGAWKKPDGTIIHTENHYLPDIKDGIVKGVYSFIYDVSENTKINTKLKGTIKQIGDLLESITDGFIALDRNLCYTYANKRVASMLGMAVEDLIGKHIWTLFPEAVGSATYLAITEALVKGHYVTNEDYYQPLDLWQENRIYPWGDGLSIFISDISDRKRRERQIRTLNDRFSLIAKATKDALFEWDLLSDKIWWSESHYVMFGFDPQNKMPSKQEWLAKILPDSGEQFSQILANAAKGNIDDWELEVTYYKDGDSYGTLLNRGFVIKDEEQKPLKILGSFIDITDRKNNELEKALLSDISIIFNKQQPLKQALQEVLAMLIQIGNFCIAEAWLISTDQHKINLFVSKAQNKKMSAFFDLQTDIKQLDKGDGLPGIAWETEQVQFWENISENELSLKREAAKKVGLKSAYGLPLLHNNEVVGVFVLGLASNNKPRKIYAELLNSLSTYIGSEIKRKLLEEELHQVFNNAPDIICIIGTDRRFKKVNPAMCAVLEYTEQELLSSSMDKFLHPEELPISQKRMANFESFGDVLSFENRYLTKSGKVIWLSWTATKSVEDGLFFCVAKDTTEKRELEELLQKASNLARIGSWEFDLDNQSMFCSDLVRDLLEVGPDFSLEIFNWQRFLNDEAYATLNKKLQDGISKGLPFDIEIEIITSKSNLKWVRMIGDAVFEDGVCKRIYGSFQDIDVRKKAEIAAKQLFEERNTILESIDDAFFATDRNWIVTYWNKTAEQMLNVPKELILNKNLWEIFPQQDSTYYYEKYINAMKNNEATRFEILDPMLLKWLEVSVYPSVDGLSVYFKDINERKNSEIKLNELNNDLTRQTKELEVSNAELEQFAYVASHDLQEPLRMVTSFLIQLEKRYQHVIDERGKRYIHFAVDGAKRMRQIILDLLEFSRIGRTDDNLEEVNLNILIDEILSLYRRKIDEKKAVIKIEKLPLIITYVAPVRQLFQNIISNALKYSHAHIYPIINISCLDKGTFWEFAISDNGIGINEEYFEKIFVIFQRLHNNDQYLGTGMGLAMSKKIINNLGGKIWLKSIEGEGTTFYFTIPK